MKKTLLLKYGTFTSPKANQFAEYLFGQIDEGFAEDDLEANLQRDKHARLCNAVNQIIDELTPSAPDFQLRDACDQLVSKILCVYCLETLVNVFVLRS
jgi:hypothetical protein